MRTFKIYSLSSFHMRDAALLLTLAVPCRPSPGRVYLTSGRLYPLTPPPTLPPTLPTASGTTLLLSPTETSSLSLTALGGSLLDGLTQVSQRTVRAFF